MKKSYLLTPGPTPVPETVSSVFARPLIHHRTPEFQALFQEVRDGLKQLFQTKQEVLTIASSGTGAMEAAITNLFSPGEKILTIDGGKFGERYSKIAQAFGLKAATLRLERGQALDLARLEAAIAANPDAKAVCFQASETSTGTLFPTEAITRVAARAGMLSVCDAITACGVLDLPMDAWGIDVMMTGSQKALMLPPGLAFIALSDRAWAANATATCPRFYFDLAREKEAQLKNQTAWTPATSLIQGLRESLRLLHEEGLPNVYARHALLAQATRAGVEALGLEILAKGAPSPAVTAVKVPATITDGKAIPRLLRDRHGITISGGQDELEGKIFRLSHFGYCGPFDITTALAGLELVLLELGHPVELGKGVGAALRVFAAAGPAKG